MNNSSGIFQVDELLATKLRGSGLEEHIEVVARIEAEHEKRLVPDLPDMTIEVATEARPRRAAVLMRAYCDFYERPGRRRPAGLARALIADPEREGVQLIARDAGARRSASPRLLDLVDQLGGADRDDERPVRGARGRGGGAAEALIEACAERCRARGAVRLEWQTAPDNLRAQAVYDRVGGRREQWLDYSLELSPASP